MKFESGSAATAIDQVSKAGTKISLLAQEKNGIEIIYQSIAANRPFTLKPGDFENLFEFIYVLEGEFKQTDESRLFKRGDYVVTRNLDHNIYFHTISPVSLLYIANGTVFESQKENIGRLNELFGLKNQSALSEQVELAVNIGLELGLDSEQVYHLGYAMALHDSSNSSLDGLRRSDQNKNQKVLSRTLDDKAFQNVAEIIIQHHERYDGTGFPHGLKGDEILIEAQILSIVVAYSSMVVGKTKFGKVDLATVFSYLEAESGNKFSPAIVESFMKIKNISE